MGVCEYCGENAGWFQSSHPRCVTKTQYSRSIVEKMVFDGTLAGRDHGELSAEVRKILSDNGVSFKYVRDAVHQGANDAASQIALKSPVSTSEFQRLVEIVRGFDGSLNMQLSEEYASQMAQRKWYSMPQLHMSHVLWQVLNHLTPNFQETGETVAFNLRTGELPIFQTGDCVTYAEERSVSSRGRSYQGVSIPVGGGIYYHLGGSQGHQERAAGLLPLEVGKILITTKSLYFGGQRRTFRISLDHVLRYEPYVDGVGVCEDGKTPKVFVFDYRGMDSGWFFYNLLSALSTSQNDFKPLEGNQGTCEADAYITNLQSAFDEFQTGNERFTELLKDAVVDGGTITADDLSRYATTVECLVGAARTLEDRFQFTSASARQKYHEARQSMEASWARFASVDEGRISADAYVPFLNDVAAFMKARNECVPESVDPS